MMDRFCAKAHFVLYAHFEPMVRWTVDEHPVRAHESFDYAIETPYWVGYKFCPPYPVRSTIQVLHQGGVFMRQVFLAHMLEFADEASKFY